MAGPLAQLGGAPAQGAPGPTPPLPQAQGNSAIGNLMQLMQQQLMNLPDQLQQAQAARAQQAQQYANLVQQAGRQTPLQAFGAGMFGYNVPGDPGAAFRAGLRNMDLNRAINAQRDVGAGEIGYGEAGQQVKDVLEAAHAMISPAGLLGLERSNMVTDRVLAQQFVQVFKTAFSTFAGKNDPEAYAKAVQTAINVTKMTPEQAATLGFDLSATPGQPAGPMGAQAAPAAAGAAPASRVAPTVDRGAMWKQLDLQRQAAERSGDFARANDLQQAQQAMISAPTATTAAAPTDLRLSPEASASWKAGEKTAEKLVDARAKYREHILDTTAPARDLSNILNEVEDSAKNLTGTRLEPDMFAATKSKMLQFLHAAGWELKPEDETAIANATDIQKLNSMLSSISTKQVSSRPGVFEFASFLKNNPSLDMTPESLHKLIGFMRRTANVSMQSGSDYAQWMEDNPKGDPLKFDAYFNSVRSNPNYWDYLRGKGLPASYSEISAAAKQQGIEPSQMLDYILKQAQKMQRR